MPHELAMLARCGHCGKAFAGPSYVVLGNVKMDADNARLMQFMEKLSGHLYQEHKSVAEGIAMAGLEYQGMLTIASFHTDSDALKHQLDVARWNIHQKTLATRLSDEQITGWVAAVLPDLQTAAQMGTLGEKITAMITAVRDNLEEPGKYNLTPIEVPGEAVSEAVSKIKAS